MPRTIIRLAAALVLLQSAAVATPAAKPAAPANDRLLTFDMCSRVLEGDLIEGKKVGLIRLVGVLAPAEGEPGWKEATEFTRRLALGKQIKLEICPERPNDYKQRIRAVVYLPDGTNLNTKLLRGGWGRVLATPPCHVDANGWKRYIVEAREAKRGLWAPPEPARKGHVRIRRSR